MDYNTPWHKNDSEGNPTEGATVYDDPWSINFGGTVPHNMINWSNNNPISGTKYNIYNQELYNFLTGRLQWVPLVFDKE